MKYITNSFIIIISFIGVFLEEHFLSDYRSYIIGLLILIYVAITVFRHKYQRTVENLNSGSDIFIVNAIVILLIVATGNIYSPLFFLIYFLCFGITFIFDQSNVFVIVIAAAFLFLPKVMENYAFESFIKIVFIVLISPLAFFFGKECKDRSKEIKRNEKKK